MEPTGAKHPKIYFLGEAPGKSEDEEGRQFVGASGRLLRARIPPEWDKQIRWNNVVRTRPRTKDGGNREPTDVEITCCRKSVEGDIAASKPLAIFGFGAVPLKWVAERDGITLWRGRRFPVNVSGHECWYYPMLHPAYILHQEGEKRGYAEQLKEVFALDLKRAFAEIDSLPEAVVHTREVAEYGVEIVEGKSGDLARLEKYLGWAKTQKLVGFDWETNGIRPYGEGAKFLTAAVGTDELSFAWALDHPGARWSRKDRARIQELTVDFLRAPKVRKAVHALGFEMEWTAVLLDKHLLRASRWEDSITQAHLIDERLNKKKGKGQGPLSLAWLSFQHFGLDIKTLDNLNKKNLAGEPLESVLRYNAIDAKYHCLLFKAQDEIIRREGLLEQYRMMKRRVPTCVLTQVKGVPTAPKVTKSLERKYLATIAEAEATITASPEVAKFKRIHGADFNPESNRDVMRMAKDVLKVEVSKNKQGNDSVDDAALRKADHPLASAILKLRKARKKESTYLYRDKEAAKVASVGRDKQVEWDIWPDGKLHTVYSTVFTEVWRLASSDPNLQNLPKRVEENREVRKQIVPPPGHSVMTADYGQIQPRIIAILSGDKRYIKSLWERYDVHTEWARRIAFAYPRVIGGKKFLDDKDAMKKLRDTVKSNWVLAQFFGARLKGVEQKLEIPEGELTGERREFERQFAGVFEWHERLHKFYKTNGYVKTLNGVKRRAPLSYNKIINSPVIMMEGEIVMDGMNRLSELADERDDWYYQPDFQIHDELGFFLPDGQIDRYSERIITEMLTIPWEWAKAVPWTVEVSVGPDLYDMQRVMDASSDNWKVKR